MRLAHILILALTACASPHPDTPVDPSALSEAIDTVFEAEIASDGPGAVAFVVFDGEILHARGYGLADLDAGVVNEPTTNFRIASLSKQFTAMAVLTLVDDGTLQLNAPVARILGAPYFEGVTVEQLLTHTSGLADNEVVFMDSWDPSRTVSNDDLLDWYVRERPPFNFEPGTRWEYSNAGYNLLATVVEKVVGTVFEDYVAARVFRPARIEGSTFFSLARPRNVPLRARSYMLEDGEYVSADGHFLNGLVGADGVFMNALDYARWDRALRRQAIVSPELHRRAVEPRVEISSAFNDLFARAFPELGLSPSAYGYGWFVSTTPGVRVAWHQGGWFGVQAMVVRDLERPLTAGMFANTDEVSLSLMGKLYRIARRSLESDKVDPVG